LSAAYPAITILMAKFFLSEQLMNVQYVGVFFVIACCLWLSYSPSNPNETEDEKKITSNKWIPFAFFALLMWSSAQTLMKYAYSLPNSNEVNMLVFNTIGGALTLGIYGVLYGIKGQKNSFSEFGKSFLPMGMMAAGDIGFIIASSKGPISVISPLTGAYPLVTLLFAAVILKEKIIKFHWLCIFILLFGIFLSSAEKDIIVTYLPFLAFLT
ncbi:MAG: DMT family transporter, partial [Cyanobacteriota bacterium]